jgi:hypothetical protein
MGKARRMQTAKEKFIHKFVWEISREDQLWDLQSAGV